MARLLATTMFQSTESLGFSLGRGVITGIKRFLLEYALREPQTTYRTNYGLQVKDKHFPHLLA
jgi:hypothetical protein